MPYTTVFEITQKPFEWWFSAVGLAGIPIGLVMIQIANKWPSQQRAKVTGYFMVVFGSLWSVGAFSWTYSQYTKCVRAYRTRSYEVVEGSVENFEPMPFEGHQPECFSVQSKRFCYSDYEIQAGFNRSASHGGPIRPGLPVRIAYYSGQILRLEIRSDAVGEPASTNN